MPDGSRPRAPSNIQNPRALRSSKRRRTSGSRRGGLASTRDAMFSPSQAGEARQFHGDEQVCSYPRDPSLHTLYAIGPPEASEPAISLVTEDNGLALPSPQP